MQADPRLTTASVSGRYPENPAKLINLSRYPLNRLGSPEGARLIADCHERLSCTGVCLLKDFTSQAGFDILRTEARALEPHAQFSRTRHNVYLEPDDDAYPAAHPRRALLETSAGAVACDRFPENAALRALYQWDPLVSFMRAVLGNKKICRSDDPLAALSINVFRNGDRFAWHFNQAEYSTSLMLQAPEVGGVFEYVPDTCPDSEVGYALVGRILRDEHNEVSRVPVAPGDLLIFSGRSSIHRVTEVRGDISRLVAVLCFGTQPNEVNSDDVCTLFGSRTQ